MIRRNMKHRFSVFGVGLFSLMTILLTSIEEGHGYIMPAEQLIEFMAKQFISFKTLIIIQTTQQTSNWSDGEEDVYEEQIWLKAPDLFYSKPLTGLTNPRKRPDMTFQRILMANEDTKILQQLFMERGIDMSLVALTRIDGVIAYHIGDKIPESPKILIEKERFLPLLLIYRPHNPSIEDVITVRFKNYQQTDQGWYPFEITVSYGSELKETYIIRSVQVNKPIKVEALYPLRFGTPPDQIQTQPEGVNDVDEERIKKIIKQFEEKYKE
ncbi:MAG: hypothetical protein JW932_12740 [Deltaproteobacteria bacterium]|nr:hypothetical protein [Deltaproteobacteria bacterium]